MLTFRLAEARDAEPLVGLVNSAYRGDTSRLGWTTEADLLAGQRTDVDAVLDLINGQHSSVLLCEQAGILLGSAHLTFSGDQAALGMFTVRPDRQGQGIGKAFLAYVEAYAREQGAACRLRMAVITRRSELIAFYRRRGYQPSGQYMAFPTDPRYGEPKVSGLELEWLEKSLLTA